MTFMLKQYELMKNKICITTIVKLWPKKFTMYLVLVEDFFFYHITSNHDYGDGSRKLLILGIFVFKKKKCCFLPNGFLMIAITYIMIDSFHSILVVINQLMKMVHVVLDVLKND